MEILKFGLIAVCFFFCVFENSGAPADITPSLVVSTTIPSLPPVSEKSEEKEGNAPTKSDFSVPKIYQMHVNSQISNRFSNTTITSKVKNAANEAQEVVFSVVLPDTAYISGFIMEVDGKNYTAYVKEKEEAKKDYDQAVASGLGAAHVAVSARDSNRFTVSVNIEPETKAAFYLTYEQLLKREGGRYEQVINIHPGQLVKDLSVEVLISESRKITDLKAPPLRSGNEIGNDNEELDPRANIEKINDTAAIIRFSPNLERQKQLSKLLKTDEENGLAGQFVVQYDVERDPSGGEVLVQDGYFVHFFAPTELDPLPKHVVFVLDTSGSMYSTKLQQLKEAMFKILEQLQEKDLFNLVEFNSNVRVWNLENSNNSIWFPTTNDLYSWGREETEASFDNFTFPNAYQANAANIEKAKTTVNEFVADGGTDIYTAIKVGLHLVELAKQNKVDDVNRQPIVIFLTDGDPTVRLTNTEKIVNKVSEINSGSRKSPIFSLSFGNGADKNFLQKISLRNYGFSRHIYEGADASLQLQDFYKKISSPLLANVTFKYEPEITSLTRIEHPVYFKGSEIVVSGWCGTDTLLPPIVEGNGAIKEIHLQPTVVRSISNVERLWAYLSIQQLLEDKEIAEDKKEEIKRKALDIALKYSFVTPVSSLVVVKPNATNAVNTEEALNSRGGQHYGNAVQRLQFSPAIMKNSLHSYSAIALNADYDDLVLATQQPFVTTDIATSTITNKLINIDWLNSNLNENSTLTLPSGTYKLGLNENVTDIVSCPKSLTNAPGQCTLIKDCPQVHSQLVSYEVYLQYSCVLQNEYAGVCCPTSQN